MSRVLLSLVSVLLLSMATASSGDVVIGDFEGAMDGWSADAGTLTFSPVGATSNWLALQVVAPGGWKIAAKGDMKANREAFGVKGTTIKADITAFEADMTTTWMQVGLVVNAQNNDDAGANNNIGWKDLGSKDIVRDGEPHTYTWEISDDLAAAIAGTDPNIWWFELALISNVDGASESKFYIDNIQVIDPAKKIIWVSYHGADDAAAQKAADFGWTEATDKAYTDLLAANGYKVTRVLTGSTPDVDLLNSADLVIIGRAVNSGHYGSASATTWNTQVTVPVINTGGYTLRKNRSGFTTGNTMVDITGDIKLTVSDPNHPIFAGIALTDGTMDNPFAGMAVYPLDPNVVTRGISINNNPANAEGTVLGTIAAPADPNDPNTPANGPVGGMVIAEWPAGATLTHDGGAGTDVLAGPRLIFLTGSREPSGITGGEAAGLYDLYDDGTKMFLNAVNYMLNPPLPPAANLLANGGFEDGTTTGWNIYGAATGTVATELTGATVADGPIEGTYSLYVDVPEKTANFWDAGLQPQGIVFEEGKKYTFSAFMKSKAGELQINMKPELAAAPWTGYGEKMMTVTEEWKEYSVTTPVFPADTAPAGFTFHIGHAVGGFWVDGMRYYEGDYVEP